MLDIKQERISVVFPLREVYGLIVRVRGDSQSEHVNIYKKGMSII